MTTQSMNSNVDIMDKWQNKSHATLQQYKAKTHTSQQNIK